MQRVGIIGGGAWGTALAQVAAQAGREVCLWAREAEVVAAVNTAQRNPLFLPEMPLHPGLRATGDLADAAGAELLLLVVPAQHLRAVAGQLAPLLPAATPLVLCAKGIEQDSGKLMSEVVDELLPGRPLAVLSGPTFAAEVAWDLPTAVTLAAADQELGAAIAQALGRPQFRPYLSRDVIGAQIGGAIKNVIAIACGIVEGRGLGDNARAALMTRGLAEMIRYGCHRGGETQTMMGLSGLGDLCLTCNSEQSRNMSLGIQLGEGRELQAILAERRSVAEGIYTAAAINEEARVHGLEMPISTAVDGVLNHYADIDATIGALLARPFRAETV